MAKHRKMSRRRNKKGGDEPPVVNKIELKTPDGRNVDPVEDIEDIELELEPELEPVENEDGVLNEDTAGGGKRRRRRFSHRHSSKCTSKCRHSRRSKRGGDGAADWVIKNFGGTVEQQYMNTFGNEGNGYAGNLIPTVDGAPAVLPNNLPQGSLALNAGPAQSGGKRRNKRRGGSWGQVLQTAAVPFALLAAQNYYGRRKTNKFRRNRSRRFRR